MGISMSDLFYRNCLSTSIRRTKYKLERKYRIEELSVTDTGLVTLTLNGVKHRGICLATSSANYGELISALHEVKIWTPSSSTGQRKWRPLKDSFYKKQYEDLARYLYGAHSILSKDITNSLDWIERLALYWYENNSQKWEAKPDIREVILMIENSSLLKTLLNSDREEIEYDDDDDEYEPTPTPTPEPIKKEHCPPHTFKVKIKVKKKDKQKMIDEGEELKALIGAFVDILVTAEPEDADLTRYTPSALEYIHNKAKTELKAMQMYNQKMGYKKAAK